MKELVEFYCGETRKILYDTDSDELILYLWKNNEWVYIETKHVSQIYSEWEEQLG